ncbi:hypothetical protein KQI65_00440 [bacterium]|nr:hypothetical protein [bacterium]
MVLSEVWGRLSKWQFAPRWVVVLILFAMLMLMYGGWYPNPNEEVYLTLAMEKVGSFEAGEILSEGMHYGESFVFNYLVGYLLKLVGIGLGRLMLLMIIGVLLVYNLVFIVNHIERSHINAAKLDLLISVMLFILLGQSIVGGEWIFLDVEPKSIAYVCVFTSLRYLLNRRYYYAAVFGSAATLFHVLVGGWWMLALGLFIIINRDIGSWRRCIGIILSGTVIPFFVVGIMLLYHPELLTGGNDGIANEIYVRIRNPHHLTLFWPAGRFIQNRFESFVFYVLSVVVGFVLGRHALRSTNGGSREYGYLMLVLSSLLVVTLFISAVDFRFTFSKYYLFRLASVHLLLTILGVMHVTKVRFGSGRILSWGYLFVALVLVGTSTRQLVFQRSLHLVDNKYRNMLEYVHRNTPKQSQIFVLNERVIDMPLSFSRKAGRRRYILNKMIPATPSNVHWWYRRIQLKTRIMNGQTALLDSLEDVDYFLTDKVLPDRPLVHSSNDLYLYSKR